MTTTTIRISTHTRNLLHEMAHAAGISMQEIIERALETYRRQQTLLAINEAYAALRTAPAAWDDTRAERNQWDTTLADGLDRI